MVETKMFNEKNEPLFFVPYGLFRSLRLVTLIPEVENFVLENFLVTTSNFHSYVELLV